MKIISTIRTITMKTTPATSTIQSYPELKELISKNKISRVYLFIGNGPKNQYPDMDAVKSNLKTFYETLNLSKNEPWLAVFGGDTYKKKYPDLGAVMYFIKTEFNPFLLAIQCWPEIDSHVDYVWHYPKELDENGRAIYGGIKNDNPIGGTNIYLSEDFRKILTGVINVDSKGRIGTQEIEYAKSKGFNVISVKSYKLSD